jgi:tripartite-type tricarboxylate transporter receptor subunit TctC
MIESGFPDLQVLAWWALAAPAGTPPEVIKRLGDAVGKAVASPEVTQKLRGMDIDPMLLGPAEFNAFLQRELPFWTSFIQKSGIKIAP